MSLRNRGAICYNMISMNQEKARKFITNELCERLKQCIGDLYGIILYNPYPNKDTPENFELLKNIASIAGELLSDSKSQKEFEELLSTTVTDGMQYKAKSTTFRMLRNFLIHFPIFKSWNEMFLTRNMLRWREDKKPGAIENYFNLNSGKTLSFSIYTRSDYFYEKKRDFKINIPKLKDDEPIYIKDFISFDDALWLFSLIGYYLEWKNWKIDPSARYMGSISA